MLVDASNAFNSINSISAFLNIRHLCPSISTKCYRAPTKLFIDGDVILLQEGTTQGDPLGMPMYALATVPLIKKLTTSVKQTWYTDDAAATGKMTFGCGGTRSPTWVLAMGLLCMKRRASLAKWKKTASTKVCCMSVRISQKIFYRNDVICVCGYTHK